MRTIEIVFEIAFIAIGIAFLWAVIRYPKAAFIDIPKAVFIDFPIRALNRLFFIGFLIDLFRTAIGHPDHDYRIEKKINFNFLDCNKYLLTNGAEEFLVKQEITEAFASLNKKITIEEFKITKAGDRLITQPRQEISFYDFHFLVQWLTTQKYETIGLIESNALTYAVYNDPNSVNLIGQTNKKQRFFISLLEGYVKKQFICLNKDIEIIEAYTVDNIKKRLNIR